MMSIEPVTFAVVDVRVRLGQYAKRGSYSGAGRAYAVDHSRLDYFLHETDRWWCSRTSLAA